MKKIALWILVVSACAGIGVFAWHWRETHAEPPFTWKTATLEKHAIKAKVTASGTLQATVTVQVGAQVSGRIQSINVDFNSTVKKGQLIAKLDPQLLQAAVEQSNANFLSAKANMTKAKAQEKDAELVLARTKQLAEQSLASAADLQTATTALSVASASTEVAKASLSQATASLHQAQVNLSYSDIFSPIDGTVISRAVDVGQTVASSLQAPVLFTIAEDLRKMQVHTSVAEGDVGRLIAGMDASFTVDAFPGQTFKGKVFQIRNAAQTVQNVVTYDAVIDVDNSDLKLRPGMTASVTVTYAERDDVLSVPNAALRFRMPTEAITAFGLPSASPSNPRGAPTDGTPRPDGTQRHPGRMAAMADGGAPMRADTGDAGTDKPVMSKEAFRESVTRRTIYVLRNGKPEAVQVTSGLSDGTVSELLRSELAVGDQVVVDVSMPGKPSSAGGAPSGGAPRMGRMF
ncbi:MAG: efflux RND transporter periplasmic adaptor subunit [Polyangiaceae bacterium]